MTKKNMEVLPAQTATDLQIGIGQSAAQPWVDPGAVAVAEREKSEVQASIMLAKMSPRHEISSFAKIMKSLERPGLAEKSRYRYPRGKTVVEGPSVVLARELAKCWGNIRSGWRVVSATPTNIHIKGYALDLESNTYTESEDSFTPKIQRKMQDDHGNAITKWVDPDERELRELINKRAALLERNSILKILPADLINDAMEKAKETIRIAASSDLKSNKSDSLKKLAKAFSDIGVSPQQIEEYIGCNIEAINDAQLADLREVYNSIKEGAAKVSEFFVHKTSIGNEMEEALKKLVSGKNESPSS